MPTNAVMIAAAALRHGVRARHGHDPMDDRDAKFCERNGWFSRHGLAAISIVFALSFFVMAGIDAAPADESAFTEKRCNSAGRHEAMPAAAGCVDPPYARARPSCWKIRAAVHRYGEQFVAELARSNGASEADIAREKKRCLN